MEDNNIQITSHEPATNVSCAGNKHVTHNDSTFVLSNCQSKNDKTTQEQLDRSERNRLAALAKLAAKGRSALGTLRTPSTSDIQLARRHDEKTAAERSERNRQLALAKLAAKKSFAGVHSSANQATEINSRANGPPSTISREVQSTKATGPLPQKGDKSCFGSNAASVKGRCVLTSKGRFRVEARFHQQMIEVFKSIGSRLYDVETKTWNFAVADHDALIKALQPLRPNVFVSPLPTSIVKMFFTPDTTDNEDVDLSRLEPTLLDSLMPFQKDGVRFGIKKQGRCLIADDMGLGKTIQALGIASYYREEWPLLVVAPSSVRYAWLEAINRWIPSVDPSAIVVVDAGKDELSSSCIVIMSYSLLMKKKDELEKKAFSVVILDESHFLKSPKSARTKACISIVKATKRLILLSGTPALSRPAELYSQINMIDERLFPSFNQFGIRYCDGKKCPWGWDVSGASNMDELLAIMENKVMIRRLKTDVMQQLPEKQRQVVILDPDKINTQCSVMKEYAQKMVQTALNAGQKKRTLLSYFHETGFAKMRAICDYILELMESDRKIICFAHHIAVLDGICSALDKKGIDYIRIDGATPSDARQASCERFQFKDICRAAVLSITAANAGITLTAAHVVVFAELFWNPGILIQAEDRAHRIGQKDCVHVQYLVAKGTADDHLWFLVKKKLEILNQVGLSKDNFSDAGTTVAAGRGKQRTLEELFSDMSELEILETAQRLENSLDESNKKGKMEYS